MKRIALATATLLIAQFASAADLTIHIDDVKNADGSVMVALFSSAPNFLKKPMNGATVQATAGLNTVVIKDLPEGDYAFAVYHDANANGKMDTNQMGIPTEDYAFSNNAMGKMGPPTFDLAKVTVPAAGLTTRVSVK